MDTLLSPGEFLAWVQAGSHPKWVEHEALLEAGQELVQGEGAGECGVASLCLKRTFAQQLVDRQNSFATANWALQDQAQALNSLQGYLEKDESKVG